MTLPPVHACEEPAPTSTTVDKFDLLTLRPGQVVELMTYSGDKWRITCSQAPVPTEFDVHILHGVQIPDHPPVRFHPLNPDDIHIDQVVTVGQAIGTSFGCTGTIRSIRVYDT